MYVSLKEESWEEFKMHATAINGKQEGSVAFLLMTSTNKSTFENGQYRVILPETKNTPCSLLM